MVEMLKTADAAVLLGLRPTTLEHWRMTRKGPSFVRISRNAVRYRRSDLENWIASIVEPANEKRAA